MQQGFNNNTTKREIALFIFCLSVMSILYATPALFSQGFSASLIKELATDCLIMTIACLPVWWLQFRRWSHLPIKRRFALHFITGPVYYLIWVGLYQVYNRWEGLPPMNSRQVLQNIGPNLLFYIQVFSSLHIDLFFREREQQFRREQELQALAHRAEINALKAQIQPHFLFNTLNSISASVPARQEHTRILIARLADMFRYALRATQQELVPLSDELDFIRTYLTLEKERFGSRLTYEVGEEAGMDGIYIPPMLLQPIVENALKHAIEPSIEGGSVAVSCVRHGKRIKISIENTGYPYQGTADSLHNSEGVGISNTAKRLQTQFGEPLHIHIAPHGGLVIHFSIPF